VSSSQHSALCFQQPSSRSQSERSGDPASAGQQATSDQLALLIFAKYPEPGKVKTRLAASLGAGAAASLYEMFIRKVLETAARSGAPKIFVAMSPETKMASFREKFPGDYELFAQIASSDLGERIIAAARHVFAQSCSRVLIIGTDSPNLLLAFLEEANRALDSHDIVIGPAEDGGYYLIGMKHVQTALFEGIAWSTSEVLAQTLERADAQKLRVHLLPQWYDVDDLPSYQRLKQDNPEFS
jgi:hypothetical protein